MRASGDPHADYSLFFRLFFACWQALRRVCLRGEAAYGGAEALAAVAARPNQFPPPPVLEVPRDRPAQPAVKGFARRPVQVTSDLGDIHRVATIVSGPVGDKGDEPLMRRIRRPRQHLVEQTADRGNDREIGALGAAAEIVALSGSSLGQDREQAARVILDIEPVADILARAVDR